MLDTYPGQSNWNVAAVSICKFGFVFKSFQLVITLHLIKIFVTGDCTREQAEPVNCRELILFSQMLPTRVQTGVLASYVLF